MQDFLRKPARLREPMPRTVRHRIIAKLGEVGFLKKRKLVRRLGLDVSRHRSPGTRQPTMEDARIEELQACKLPVERCVHK